MLISTFNYRTLAYSRVRICYIYTSILWRGFRNITKRITYTMIYAVVAPIRPPGDRRPSIFVLSFFIRSLICQTA